MLPLVLTSSAAPFLPRSVPVCDLHYAFSVMKYLCCYDVVCPTLQLVNSSKYPGAATELESGGDNCNIEFVWTFKQRTDSIGAS
jgi:hypothetical protein